MAHAKLARWASPERDKENLDPARVSTRAKRAKRPSKRDLTRAELRARLRQRDKQVADLQRALDRCRKRAAAAERRAATNARLARKWMARARLWHVDSRELASLRTALHSMTSHRNRLRKDNRALKLRVARAPARTERAVGKSVALTLKMRRTLHLKDRGRVPERVRRIFRTLVASAHVSAARVTQVLRIVARGLDIDVVGSCDRRTVARAVIEGGVGADLQIVEAMRTAKGALSRSFVIRSDRCKGASINMDGTTHKNRNYVSVHIYVVPADGSPARKYFTGLHTAVNHTSETQFSIVQKFIERLVEIWSSCPLGSHVSVTLLQLIDIIRGMNTDHAEDQKKLARLIKQWIHEGRMELQGEHILLQLPSLQQCLIIAEETGQMIDSLGGPVVWQQLDTATQARHHNELWASIARRYGQAAFDAMTPSEKRAADFFVWTGCCMHKDLNAVKGGNARMQQYWSKAGVAPVKLMNADNAAATSLDPSSAAAARARDISGFGAVKTVTLLGMHCRNKNDKLGQQDTTGIFFELHTGRPLTFPDTSNTRFQCFCSAAAVVITNLELFRLFIRQVGAKKDSGTFTNIEKNIMLALDDDPTITELLVLAFYNEIISHPYMIVARAPGQNGLDLGPLHERVIAHIRAILADPEILLSHAEDAWKRATLDGKPWTNPHVVQRIHELAPSLPHFRGALVDFFEGVLETFIRFSSEFVEGGVVNTMTEEERQSVFLPSTNDCNEGELGSGRQAFRRYGRISLLRHNSATCFDRNGAGDYMDTLSDDVIRWIYAEARRRDAAGSEKKARSEQATYDAEKAASNTREREERAAKVAQREAEIDAVKPITSTDELTQRRWLKDELIQQLDWFRRWHAQQKTGHTVPVKSKLTTNEARHAALRAALEAFATHQPTAPAPVIAITSETTLVDLLEQDLGEEELLRE